MQAWESFVNTLETEMGGETIQKWVRSLKILRFDACNLYLEAKDPFQSMWFEEHIRQKIQSRFFNNNQKPIKVHLSIANLPGKKKNQEKMAQTNQEASQVNCQLVFDELDPHLTFPTFVLSESNFLTCKVFKQIAGVVDEGEEILDARHLSSLTPIYVSGPSGSGKTHLLMAVADALKKQKKNVVYAHAQTFTDHVVSAIRAGEMRAFRQAYRNSDVLIIDDVHVFSRKGATQEEFFHTFNALHMEGKHIILSANCNPGELQFIEPRLVSRFEWGIALNLEIPSKEKLQSILSIKTKSINFPLNPKVVEFLIDSFPNCKVLFKAFEALILRCHLSKVASNQLQVIQTKKMLEDLLKEQQEAALTPPRLLQYISEHFGIRPEDILGKAQTRDCVLPRQIAMHICRHELKLPYLKIGDLFSRDHSTVMSSVKQIQKGIETGNEEIIVPFRAIMKKI